MDDGPLVTYCQPREFRGLPLEHRVGETFEGFAQHHEPSMHRIACTQVKIGKPPAAPSVAPFRGEHDQVEGVRSLDLEPARAAAAGSVRRIDRFGHNALVSAGDCSLEKAP